MSLSDDLLTILFDYSGGYKLMRQRLAGLNATAPRRYYRSREIKDAVLANALHRLKKDGLIIRRRRDLWTITEKGKRYLKMVLKTKPIPKIFPPHSDKNNKKRKNELTMVVFDVPEKRRKERDWLRAELLILGFKPLQKSVWIGKKTLPESFVKNLDELNILPCIHIFGVNKKGTISLD